MDFSSPTHWLLLGGVGFAAVLWMLRCIAVAIEAGQRLHDVEVHAAALRRHYLSMQEVETVEVIEVEPIEDDAIAA